MSRELLASIDIPMDSMTQSPPASEYQETRQATCPLLCPVCGGLLLLLRRDLRCQRCGFAICEGCEGGVDEA
jgi:hypothetical protein